MSQTQPRKVQLWRGAGRILPGPSRFLRSGISNCLLFTRQNGLDFDRTSLISHCEVGEMCEEGGRGTAGQDKVVGD